MGIKKHFIEVTFISVTLFLIIFLFLRKNYYNNVKGSNSSTRAGLEACSSGILRPSH